jgi:hypothetical protein
MQKKLKLLRADKYAYHICAQLMAKMVVSHLDGIPGPKSLGCEQGDIPAWDDIVQEQHDGSFLQIQVKRQVENFKPDANAVRANKSKGGVGLQDLSPFDESIAALADWFSSLPATNAAARSFLILVPDLNVRFKKELTMAKLEELCVACRNPLVTIEGLEKLATSDGATAHLFDWLTTWCRFKDWTHIFSALKYLKLEMRGLEEQIDSEAAAVMERHFDPAEEALAAIRVYLEDNVTHTDAATPRHIHRLLSKHLRPNIPVWTQYATSVPSVWGVSGITGPHAAHIEHPAETVPIFWRGASSKHLKIFVQHRPGGLTNSPLMPRLLRLAVHLRAPGQVSVAELGPWNVELSSAVGNTLGTAEDDLGQNNLQWVESHFAPHCSHTRQLEIHEIHDEVDCLDAAMGDVVWALLKEEIGAWILKMPRGDLQPSLDRLWKRFQTALDSDPASQHSFLSAMLNPKSEGLGKLGSIRVGPKTVLLLRDGLVMLLVTAVALKRDLDIDALVRGSELRIIALRFWNGPAAASKYCREIVRQDSDDDVVDLIGKESAPIVLLSTVSDTLSGINRESFGSDKETEDIFAAPRRARLAVTNTRNFDTAVKTGTVKAVSELLERELLRRRKVREENLNKIT